MRIRFFRLSATLVAYVGLTSSAFATPQSVRWIGADDANSELSHILTTLQARTGFALSAADFLTIENLDLANNHFQMLVQTVAGTPVEGMAIRLWTDLNSGATVQLEARLEDPAMLKPAARKFALLHALGMEVSEDRALELARARLRADLPSGEREESFRLRDAAVRWRGNDLVRVFKFRGKHGTARLTLSLRQGEVLESRYQEFPHADEQSIPVQVYPIYEEASGVPGLLPRVPASLNHLKTRVGRLQAGQDIYAPLNTRAYLESQLDNVRGLTEAGRAQGFWAMSYLKQEAAGLRAALPTTENSYNNGGVILEGRYATVSLYPEVTTKFTGLDFTPAPSGQFKPNWTSVLVDGNAVGAVVPGSGWLGKPLRSAADAWDRPARRLPDHDPVGYLNDGFDEIQVYYAIDTLFASLHAGGFTDPELSTRPFNAFLYDPDISDRDNAFYTDDTINFATYSPGAGNFARDNSTIWHELGHGVMDRLMGDELELADTGGLSEGMADFVADLVIAEQTRNQPFPGSDDFRIKNQTGFNLTNEVHDDGEAYGGSMHDLLMSAIARDGMIGRNKVADVTLEAMRLSRDHPALTAQDWFAHLLFADTLGHAGVRAPGELHDLIVDAVEARNFSLDESPSAAFSLKHGAIASAAAAESTMAEVAAGADGSRNRPITVNLARPTDTASFPLSVALQSSAHYAFKYPIEVRVSYSGGPLQGALHWAGKEHGFDSYLIHSDGELLNFNVAITGKCDRVNREDGSCVDFAYVQLWNQGEADQPSAKKRFYLRLAPPSPSPGPAPASAPVLTP